MKRRAFFGAAAASIAATTVGGRTFGRTFARTLDRPPLEESDSDTLIIRLYNLGAVVHTQKLKASIVKEDNDHTSFGANEDFLMENFAGYTDDCSVEVIGVPIEKFIGYGHANIPLFIAPGNNLTISASAEGLMKLT